MKLFLEIADAIETNILNGNLLSGDKLPSVRSMAKRLEVSSGTNWIYRNKKKSIK